MLKNLYEPVVEFKAYGFAYTCKDYTRLFIWNRVTEIIAYKTDLITFDEIRLKISDNDGGIILTEECSCFEKFNEKILEIFPEIDENWYPKIILPSFAINTTVLYKRKVS